MIAVIGDVHGCFYTLQNLVEKIKEKYSGIPFYCVGDLVDRGNHSYEVMEYVKSEKIVFTPGNHDFMFYYYMKDPLSVWAKAWFHNGADATLRSYENRMEKIDEHLELIEQAPLFIDHKDCFISHAGISIYLVDKLPKNILEDHSRLDQILREDLYDKHSIIWSRDELLNIGKLQIVGHTRRQEVYQNKINNVLYIDTAAVAHNKLSAVIVDRNELIEIISENTDTSDVAATSI